MKIIEVNLVEDITKAVGLRHVSMKKIGTTVLLAGKNGSGKTRLLNLIRQQAKKVPALIIQKGKTENVVKSCKQQIERLNKQIKSFEQQIEQQPQQKKSLQQQIGQQNKHIKIFEQQIEQQIEQQPQQKKSLQQQVEQQNEQIKDFEQKIEQQPQQKKSFQQQIEQRNKQIKDLEQEIEHQYEISRKEIPIQTDTESKDIAIVDFVPTNLRLEDWAVKSKKDWERDAQQAKSIGVANLSKSTLSLIQKIQEDWWEADHQNSVESAEVKEEAAEEYSRLNELIYEFLGTKLSRSKGYSTLFGKPIAETNLSLGQIVLLQLCIAIYAQGGSLSNYVIFMDEPENHLHPSAVIDLLDKFKKLQPNSQIWIATHSIPLLSHFDASSLWFVEGGIVKYSGKEPERVLRSLLGDEERIQKLRDFISLPDELARNRFAFECLCPPKGVETDSSDPQSMQLNEQLEIIWKAKTSISLLDFGAGKGRMIANLANYATVSPTTLNYHAYDPCDSDKDNCLNNIALSYDRDAESRYHNSIEALRSGLDDNYFDVIVLSNVLHEIPHTKWCEVFTDIETLLKPEGNLLLIEDCLLPTGERPHVNGFLVFSTLHFKKLFNIPSTEEGFIKHDARFESKKKRGRLMAHLIPSQYLQNISAETITRALQELKKSSITAIQEIRNGDVTYSNGLAHSFWIQQLANATLCLSEFGVNQ